jgi:hypothetical protein
MIVGANATQANTHEEVASVFERVKQRTKKNSKVIENLILDVKLENTLRKTKSTKPVMPTADNFRRQLVNF